MLREVIEGLDITPTGFYVDCTFGRGGHARAILAQLGPRGRLLATDRDAAAIAAGSDLMGDPRLELVHERFSAFDRLARERSMWGRVNGVLLDLGVSSPQLDDALRGFSFAANGPIDMRMDPSRGVSAAAWLNGATEAEIADCLWRYGEERHSRRIARRLVEARRDAPIADTARLAAVVNAAIPGRRGRIHPATRTFQALRIQVNDELDELSAVLVQASAALAPGGRLAVIAFHSLEDRIVKRLFRDLRRASAGAPETPRFDTVTRKPLRPGALEVQQNPRARSARLRILERLA